MITIHNPFTQNSQTGNYCFKAIINQNDEVYQISVDAIHQMGITEIPVVFSEDNRNTISRIIENRLTINNLNRVITTYDL